MSATAKRIHEMSVTIPWRNEEKVYVNGAGLVYTLELMDRLLVRLPGGGKATTQELMKRGCVVRLPRFVRAD